MKPNSTATSFNFDLKLCMLENNNALPHLVINQNYTTTSRPTAVTREQRPSPTSPQPPLKELQRATRSPPILLFCSPIHPSSLDPTLPSFLAFLRTRSGATAGCGAAVGAARSSPRAGCRHRSTSARPSPAIRRAPAPHEDTRAARRTAALGPRERRAAPKGCGGTAATALRSRGGAGRSRRGGRPGLARGAAPRGAGRAGGPRCGSAPFPPPPHLLLLLLLLAAAARGLRAERRRHERGGGGQEREAGRGSGAGPQLRGQTRLPAVRRALALRHAQPRPLLPPALVLPPGMVPL